MNIYIIGDGLIRTSGFVIMVNFDDSWYIFEKVWVILYELLI